MVRDGWGALLTKVLVYTSIAAEVFMARDHSSIVDQIANECLLGHWRKVNRVLTSIYEAEMRDWGLKASQLNLLVAVARAGPVRRIDLGRRGLIARPGVGRRDAG